MRKTSWTIILLAISSIFALSSPVEAGDDDALDLMLDSIAVIGYNYSKQIKVNANGSLSLNMNALDNLPKIFGNADPMRYTQTLPGIQSNNEYRSGVNIQGCDNSHNTISIDGVPIYNVNHLLGFFSIFNGNHYSTINIDKWPTTAMAPNRLGGGVTISIPETATTDTRGDISVGLISSQATIHTKLSNKTTLSVSARGSYLNLLYSHWLRSDEQSIKYSFFDTNLTLTHSVNTRNKLVFDFYAGQDHGSLLENDYLSNSKVTWGNVIAAIHHLYHGDGTRTHSAIYVTSYKNNFLLNLSNSSYRMPSHITDVGAFCQYNIENLSFGAEFNYHNILPQSISGNGLYSNVIKPTANISHSIEASAYGNYSHSFTDLFSISGGLRTSMFYHNGSTFAALDPVISVNYDNSNVQASLSYSIKHQYLHQTGFSDMGLPSEYWFAANGDSKPQYGHIICFNLAKFLARNRFRISLDLFYRSLHNQIEYSGNVLDIVNKGFDPRHTLIQGDGENYGFSIMALNTLERLSGWISYTFTHARRRFHSNSVQGRFPANHERPHELNLVATFRINKRWTIAGTMIFASGTPYTRPEYLALIDNNVMIKYGYRNNSRLKPYFRLDLSITYNWTTRSGGRHAIDFSLYNATGYTNELFYHMKTNKNNLIGYRPISFLVKILPSISYHYKF